MDLEPEDLKEFWKTEMQLIQGVFNKYDDMIFRSRNWFITLWLAIVGYALTQKVSQVMPFALLLPLVYWFLEGLLRYQYWYKYVVRYRAIRDHLNTNSLQNEKLSVLDLTHHYGVSPRKRERIKASFLKLEPSILYLVFEAAATLIWVLVARNKLH